MSIISSVNISCDNCKYRVKSKADEPCAECSQAYSLKFEYDNRRPSDIPEHISNISKDIKQEKNMTDKIQMTEEQAEKMMFDCFDFEQGWEKTKSNLRKKGYIIKSELQQKVEEAKRMWDTKTYWTPLEHIQREAIELLEQSHPEFKK